MYENLYSELIGRVYGGSQESVAKRAEEMAMMTPEERKALFANLPEAQYWKTYDELLETDPSTKQSLEFYKNKGYSEDAAKAQIERDNLGLRVIGRFESKASGWDKPGAWFEEQTSVGKADEWLAEQGLGFVAPGGSINPIPNEETMMEMVMPKDWPSTARKWTEAQTYAGDIKDKLSFVADMENWFSSNGIDPDRGMAALFASTSFAASSLAGAGAGGAGAGGGTTGAGAGGAGAGGAGAGGGVGGATGVGGASAAASAVSQLGSSGGEVATKSFDYGNWLDYNVPDKGLDWSKIGSNIAKAGIYEGAGQLIDWGLGQVFDEEKQGANVPYTQTGVSGTVFGGEMPSLEMPEFPGIRTIPQEYIDVLSEARRQALESGVSEADFNNALKAETAKGLGISVEELESRPDMITLINAPEFKAPEYDTGRVSQRAQEIAGPSVRKLQTAVERALSYGRENPNQKQAELRELLSGYGEGLGSVVSGSRAAATGEYQKEYESQYAPSLINYQQKVSDIKAANDAAMAQAQTTYGADVQGALQNYQALLDRYFKSGVTTQQQVYSPNTQAAPGSSLASVGGVVNPNQNTLPAGSFETLENAWPIPMSGVGVRP